MKEEWRDVNNYEGLYQVSDIGRVRSMARNTTKGRILKQSLGEFYLMVNLSKLGITKVHNVHRLVAEAFIPNPQHYPQVNHKRGIQTDNRANQLEWCSASFNQKHRFETLNHCPYNRQLLQHEVFEIYSAKKYHGYRVDLAKKFNVTVDVVESIRMGRNYKNFTKQLEQ